MPSPFNQLFGNVDQAQTGTGAQSNAITSTALAAPTGGVVQGKDAPKPEGGSFVNFGDVLNLNKSGAEAEVGKATKPITDETQGLQGFGQPDKAPHTDSIGGAVRGGNTAQAAATTPGGLLAKTGAPATNILATQQASDGGSPYSALGLGGSTPPTASPTGTTPTTPSAGPAAITPQTAGAPAAPTPNAVDTSHMTPAQKAKYLKDMTDKARLGGKSGVQQTPQKNNATPPPGPAAEAVVDPYAGVNPNDALVKTQQQAAADIQAKDDAARLSDQATLGKYDQATKDLNSYGSDGGQALLTKGAGKPATAMDAALMGAAGGKSAFDSLGQQFGGKKDANGVYGGYSDTFLGQSTAAHDARTAQLAGTNDLIGKLQNSQSQWNADKATRAATTKSANDTVQAKQTQRAKNLADWEKHSQNGGTGDWKPEDWIRNIGISTSPTDAIARATGNEALMDKATNYFEGESGGTLDSRTGRYRQLFDTNGDNKDVDRDIWMDMSPQDWNAFYGMSLSDAKAWLESQREKKKA